MRKWLSKQQRERLIREFGHVPTKEEVFTKIRASVERMTWVLAGAWESAPDDPAVKKKLVEAVAKAAKLRSPSLQRGSW